jgi:hypothetical protein
MQFDIMMDNMRYNVKVVSDYNVIVSEVGSSSCSSVTPLGILL